MKYWSVVPLIAVVALCSTAPANRIEIKTGSFLPASVACWAGDQLSFRNTTSEDHDPGVLNKDGKFVGFFQAPLKPGAVSMVFSPPLDVDAEKKPVKYTLRYVCRLHQNEQGEILVVPTP